VIRPAYRDVTVFEYLGGFRATLLEKVFCSEFWLELSCREVEQPAGNKVRVDLAIYPPGGKRRPRMRRCGICDKWTPPDGEGRICADCLTEAEAEAFQGRLDRLRACGNEWLIDILKRISWRRQLIQHREGEDADNPQEETAFMSDDLADKQIDSLGGETQVPFECRTTSGRHWLAEVLDAPEKPAARRAPWAVASAIRNHLLWVARDPNRRAAGCNVVLLPDDEDKLREEIAHCEANGHVMARAKCPDRVGPHSSYHRPRSRRKAKR